MQSRLALHKKMKIEINNESNFISHLAERLIENQMGKHMVWEERGDGSEGYTDEAQDLFNETWDIIQNTIQCYKL